MGVASTNIAKFRSCDVGSQGNSGCHSTPSHAGTRARPSFPNSLFVTCRVCYRGLLCKTFGDPAVFQPCRNGAAMIVQHLRQDFESRHPELQVYRWAFQWNKGLPTARIPPKGSKQFSKAGPIVAYTKCWHTRASSFLATAFYSFRSCKYCFPQVRMLILS